MTRRYLIDSIIVQSRKFFIPLFFIAIFCLYTTPIEDGDFFWHIRTGQWVWEHKTLPLTDPFSYTGNQENLTGQKLQRAKFALKQYWLGQLILYGIWNLAESKGIVLLRAFSYTAILLLLFLWMRKYSKGILPLIFILLIGNLLRDFPNERPQLFTFIFMPLVLFILEMLRVKDKKFDNKTALFLPLLMIIWANTHGGYILGIGIVMIYLITHIVLSLLKKDRLDIRLVILLFFSSVITLVNPIGYLAIKEFFYIFYLHPEQVKTVYEQLTPFQAALKFHEFYVPYWIFFLLSAVILMMNFKKIYLSHLIILISLAILSLTGLRFMPFFLMTAPLLLIYVKEQQWNTFKGIVFACLISIWFLTANWKDSLRFETGHLFPSGAVKFIELSHPAERLFNNYEWGGYIIWHLPSYKVFIDGRAIVEKTSDLYDKVMWTNQWHEILNAFDVNTLIIPGISRMSGETFPLIYHLLNDEHWFLIYMDDVSLVFVRNIPLNSELIEKYSMRKERIYGHIIKMSEWLIKKNPDNAGYWLSMADALYFMGHYKEASDSYQRVLSINPEEQRAKKMLDQFKDAK